MKVIDLVGEYVSHDLYQRDYSAYEQVYPALFDHYRTYWAPRDRSPRTIHPAQLLMHRECILAELPAIERAFRGAGFDVSDLRVVLFVGVDTSNGHAMREAGEFVIWLPVETYQTACRVRIFVTHEIAHALHYAGSHAYYFDSQEELKNLGRQLVTEGLATYLTQEVLGVEPLEALWADYVSLGRAERWLRLCEENKTSLAELCIRHFKEASHRGLFLAEDSEDIYNFRAGYFLGLEAIEGVVARQCLGIPELLSMGREQLDGEVLKSLARMQSA